MYSADCTCRDCTLIRDLRAWHGYRNGERVATYPDRWAAEHALERREVQSISPQ